MTENLGGGGRRWASFDRLRMKKMGTAEHPLRPHLELRSPPIVYKIIKAP